MKHSRSGGYTVVRWILILIVLAGIALAVRNSLRALFQQQAAIEAEISQIRGDLSASASALEESSVTERRARLETLQGQLLEQANFRPLPILFAAACYGLALVISALYFHAALDALGYRVPIIVSLSAHLLGQSGKYVPGKAMVVLLRCSALHRYAGVPLIPGSVAVMIETLTMMASGGAIGGIMVAFIPAPLWLRLLAIFLGIATAIPTLPPFFRRLLQWLQSRRYGEGLQDGRDGYTVRFMIRGWLWMTLAWLLIGTSFWSILLAIPGSPPESVSLEGWLTAAATITLAIVAGFLSLIPGGVGVREAVIAVLLAPLTGAGPALVAAVVARLIFLVVEVLAAIVAIWSLRRSNIKPSQPPSV